MSDVICTNRGVIAGCGFAVSVIKCFTLDVYDRMYYLWPSLDISVVVDDSTLQASGSSKQVVVVVSQATKLACQLFADLKMVVSVDKGQVVASQDNIARQIAMTLSSHRFQSKRAVKQLGLDRKMARGEGPSRRRGPIG